MSVSSRRSVKLLLPDEEPDRDANDSDEHFKEIMGEGLDVDEDLHEVQNQEDVGDESTVPEPEAQPEKQQQIFFDQTQMLDEEVYGEIEGMEAVTDEEADGTEAAQNPSDSENLDLTKSETIEEDGSEQSDDDSQVNKETQSVSEDDAFATTRLSLEAPSMGGEIRRSIVPSRGRRSIFYDIEGRMRTSVGDLEKMFALNQQEDILVLDDLQEGAEAEGEATAVEEEEERLDRIPYYEKYDRLFEESFANRCRNFILQKMTIMYLKRRKTENIIKDIEPPMDQTLRYGQKLDAYQELMHVDAEQRASMAEEMKLLKENRNLKIEELKQQFKSMQTKESNVGHGLIYAKTGTQISDKLVDRLLRRQTALVDQVSTMRLKCIKLKGLVQEKAEEIIKLDTLENNLLLANFEQLKSENRNHADKMEERDEELTRLRTKCQNTIQILAHVREKSSALDSDLTLQQETFADIDDRTRDNRENLAFLKHTRDEYRHMTQKLKDNSGLLLKPTLLIDMVESQNKYVRLQGEIIKLKNDVDTKQNKVRKLRKTIEVLIEEKKAHRLNESDSYKSGTTNSSKTLKPKTVYKKRPTMYMPLFKEDAFEGILKIKPNPRVFNRKR